MSHLEKLLEGVEVEWKTLGEISAIVTKQTGFDYTKYIKKSLVTTRTDNTIPYIQTKFFNGKKFNYNTDYYIPEEIANKFPKITLNERCILFSIVGASIGNVGLFQGNKKCFLGGAICVVKLKSNNIVDYLYYCIDSKNVQKQIQQKTKGAGQASLTVEDIRNFIIPIPPHPVQKEIVRILDTYTEQTNQLTAELATELAARKKQYNYYREQLFSFDEGEVEWKALGEFSNVLRGRRLTRDQLLENEKFPVFHGGLEPLGFYGQNNRPANSVMVINVGASAGIVGYSDKDFWSSDGCYSIEHTEILNNKFLYYFLIGQQHFLQSRVRKAGIPTLDAQVIEKVQVPIPSLEEQARIVSILDKFDTLTTSISEGLPKEIELRKKQYEYYRDLLLTFPKKNIES